jgi:hypothetical protein
MMYLGIYGSRWENMVSDWCQTGQQSICNRTFIQGLHLRRQSIKKPNLWNSEPVSARSTLAMVALCIGDVKFHSDTSSIMPCQLVIELHALEWVCLALSMSFCKLINEGSWGATRLGQILFQTRKNFYGDFSDVATGLWRGLIEWYAVSLVVRGVRDLRAVPQSAFQKWKKTLGAVYQEWGGVLWRWQVWLIFK